MTTKQAIVFPLSLIICICLICANALAQKHYKDYKISEIVYNQNFNEQDTGWLDDDTMVTIHDGYLDHKNFLDSGYFAHPYKLKIDTSKNFEIEFRAQVLGTKKRRDDGILFWGRKGDNSNYWYFGNRKASSIFSREKLNNKTRMRKVATGKITRHAFNIYTLRRIGDRYYFFVNYQFTRANPHYIPLYGNMIGLGSSAKNEVLFDYVRVSYLVSNK